MHPRNTCRLLVMNIPIFHELGSAVRPQITLFYACGAAMSGQVMFHGNALEHATEAE